MPVTERIGLGYRGHRSNRPDGAEHSHRPPLACAVSLSSGASG